MLTRHQLRSYKNWIGKNPEFVLQSAIRAGGWTKVFPAATFDVKYFLWAHRVRNFFNQVPSVLFRVGPDSSVWRWASRFFTSQELELGKTFLAVMTTPSLGDVQSRVKESVALDWRFVYRDPYGRHWIQMAPGGTGYHWNSNGKAHPTAQTAIWASAIGQQNIPVFKLVSPDGSGGSYEVIIRNNGKVTLCDYDEWFQVLDHKLVTNIEHFGSYNYSETGVVGDAEHVRRDVDPHNEDPLGYIFPTPGQVFPATYKGSPIAKELVFPAPEWM